MGETKDYWLHGKVITQGLVNSKGFTTEKDDGAHKSRGDELVSKSKQTFKKPE